MYNSDMAKTGPKPIPWQDRIMRHVSPEPNSGCWLWERSHNGVGYGTLGVGNGKSALVHRLMWELTNGPVPDGMFVCHRCDMPPCCNPDHLFLGTPGDNMRDMHAKGRYVSNSAALTKPACKRGHPFTKENTAIYGGHRVCRECFNARARRWRAAKKAQYSGAPLRAVLQGF